MAAIVLMPTIRRPPVSYLDDDGRLPRPAAPLAGSRGLTEPQAPCRHPKGGRRGGRGRREADGRSSQDEDGPARDRREGDRRVQEGGPGGGEDLSRDPLSPRHLLPVDQGIPG